MRSDDLAQEQCRKLSDQVGRQLGYLNRLQARMVNKGFPPDDPLLILANEAADAMHRLRVAAHYLSCDGTGRPPRR